MTSAETARTNAEPNLVAFAVIPFDMRLKLVNDRSKLVYDKVCKPTLEGHGFTCVQIEETSSLGQVAERMWKELQRASLVLCDMTSENPNVFYALGIAHALKKPTIMISRSAANLPFDVNQWQTIQYEDTNVGLVELKDKLAECLRAMFPLDPKINRPRRAPDSPLVAMDELEIQRLALLSDSLDTKRYAVKFLGERGDKFSFERIKHIACMPGQNNDLARDAFTALYKIDPQAARPILEGLVSETWRDDYVREHIIALVGKYPADEALVQKIIERLGDKSWGVQESACKVLGLWSDPRARGPLQQMLGHPELRVKLAAVNALERLRKTPSSVEGKEPHKLSPKSSTRIRQMLADQFDEDETKNLCYELEIDYHSLPAEGVQNKQRELVAYCDRRNRVMQLLELGKKERPDGGWQDMIDSLQSEPSPGPKD